MKSYKQEYRQLLKQIREALRDGTVLTTEFRHNITERTKAIEGDDSIDYLVAEVGDVMIGWEDRGNKQTNATTFNHMQFTLHVPEKSHPPDVLPTTNRLYADAGNKTRNFKQVVKIGGLNFASKQRSLSKLYNEALIPGDFPVVHYIYAQNTQNP